MTVRSFTVAQVLLESFFTIAVHSVLAMQLVIASACEYPLVITVYVIPSVLGPLKQE